MYVHTLVCVCVCSSRRDSWHRPDLDSGWNVDQTVKSLANLYLSYVYITKGFTQILPHPYTHVHSHKQTTPPLNILCSNKADGCSHEINNARMCTSFDVVLHGAVPMSPSPIPPSPPPLVIRPAQPRPALGLTERGMKASL